MGPKKRKASKPLEPCEEGASCSKFVKQMPERSDSSQPSQQQLSVVTEEGIMSSKWKFPNIDELKSMFKEVSESAKNYTEIEIPDSVSIMEFAKCRASEIASMMKEIECKKPKQTLQQLPHYMRRRAASHNANRVPRRLREKAMREISKAKKTKRPSRKHRRQPSNLMLDYHRRAKKFVWLETHIWFAKRFKLAQLWGYRIPFQPIDKCERSLYRAATKHASLQDLSYYCCLELEGPQDVLLHKLSQLTSTSVGLTFASKAHLYGKREGRIVLYHPNLFPFCAIGSVTFLWQPLEVSENDSEGDGLSLMRKLWIWCHPTIHEQLIGVLSAVFNLQEVAVNNYPEDNVDNIVSFDKQIVDEISAMKSIETEGATKKADLSKTQSDKKRRKKLRRAIHKALTKKKLVEECITDLNDTKVAYQFRKNVYFFGERVKLSLLKDKLVRHRLIGPLSQSIITDVLKIADVSCTVQCDVNDRKWWEDYYANIKGESIQDKQKFWEQMEAASSPEELPSGIVLGLTVRDPRLDIPPKRTPATSKAKAIDKRYIEIIYGSNLDYLAHSPIWDEDVRNKVTATKQPESELNRIRAQFVVPGSQLELGREESRVPVIAVQQPSIDGYGSGWDLIAPLGWGMAFWLAFIYRGARASGLREQKVISRDMASPLLPYNYPDTQAGKEWEEDSRKKMMAKHFCYSFAKRPNFKKLGILAPFFIPWEVLTSEWVKQLPESEVNTMELSTHHTESLAGSTAVNAESTKNYFVLRSRKEVCELRVICKLLEKLSKRTFGYCEKECALIKKKLGELEQLLPDNNRCLKFSLVGIKLASLGKGTVFRFSGIYLPDKADLLKLKADSKYPGPVESVHFVDKAKKEKTKRKRAKHKAKIGGSEKGDLVKQEGGGLFSSEKLQRPNVENLILNCSRKLIGYVEFGGYSYFKGCGFGIGHCSFIALLEAFKTCLEFKLQPVVLVRSQNSYQYRFAFLDVNIQM